MRKVKLLVLLILTGLQFTIFVAAQGPKHPEVKRRGRESASADKPGKWNREQKAEVKRGTEKESADKKSREERVSGHPRTRDKVSAWDRRQDRTREARTLEGKTAGRRRVEKASRWDKRPNVESRSNQQAKLREHVFRGWINGRGRPVGYHYEGTRGTPAEGIKVVEGSRSKPDKNGVYKAEVEARGVRKGYHTFFPRSWSRADVEKAINEASVKPIPTKKSTNDYIGKSSSGVTVGMKINNGVIKTAYPIYEP